jgi:PAS domain S-box-containing protein
MKLFRNFPIQRKMLATTLLICGAVLCVAIATLFTFQVLNFRSRFQSDTITLAEIIGNNSTAALAFKDEQTAAEVIGALKAKPTIVAASLALPDGSLFAQFGKAETETTRRQFPPDGKFRYYGGQLLVTQPIYLRRERAGTLYLRSDYQQTLRELLEVYGLVVLSIVLVSIPLALFLSARLGRRITGPILQLARTAEIIGEKKDYSLRATMDSDADEVGRLTLSFNEMLGRIQSQDAALSLSQQKMEALIHSIDGIVWERSPSTFQYTFVSRQSEEILGYTPGEWLADPHFWQSKLHPQDAGKALKQAEELGGRGQHYTHEYRMLSANNRTVWIRESGTVLMENGNAVAVRGIFQDVTRQKLDAEELDKLNRQLMGTSRLAGMAEVATGVLHNVGNVLNSVSVSATLVAEGLRRSKVTNLCRATSMLRNQNGHLAEFLATDPKGKLVPEYIATVAEQLAGEQSRMSERMDSVGKHIEHIKEIVAMQQSYAKVSGVYENLSVSGLIEDALRMNAAAFDRHRIDLVRDFDDKIPPVCVDRHKVLQILINLLRNAKHAMTAHSRNDKQMIIRVKLAAPDRIKISVADNGIGISPENLTRIFNHGFTTKKDGHGFGLHSGANAAKEMGGTLTARSAGVGQGAEFTLEFPTAAAAKDHSSAKELLPA